jgi:serralysin
VPNTESVLFAGVQTGGRIIVTAFNSGSGNFVDRLQSDGTFDPSFAGGPSAPLSFFPEATTLRPDGRVVLAGASSDGHSILVSRLNFDGTPDSSFGTGGTTRLSFVGTPNVDVSAIALQSDGSVVLAGESQLTATGQTNLLVARLTASGALDTSFASFGEHVYDLGSPSIAEGVAALPSGKILIGGSLTVNLDLAVGAESRRLQ